MPVRMLRYRSDIWEAAVNQKKQLVPIIQAVVFFLPEHDNGLHSLTDYFGNTGIQYNYIVLRAWEMSRQEVRQRKLFGLYPLLPLMQGRPGEKPQQVLDECVRPYWRKWTTSHCALICWWPCMCWPKESMPAICLNFILGGRCSWNRPFSVRS